MFTTLADGVTRSTSELDLRFEEAQKMKTTDAFGRPHPLLQAQQAEALAGAFEQRHREFGDGAGSAGYWYSMAAIYYKQHATSMEDCAKACWRKPNAD